MSELEGDKMAVARRLYPGPIDFVPLTADPDGAQAVRTEFGPLVHPDFETVADPSYQMLLGEPGEGASAPGGLSTYAGIEGLMDAFRPWCAGWERWLVTPVDFLEVDGRRVFVGIEINGRSKAQGIEMTVQGANVLSFDAGRLKRAELFFRREDGLRAAGLA